MPPAGMACSSASAAGPSAPGGGLRTLSSSSAAAAAPARDVGGIARLRSIVRQVVAEDGVQGLWRGATPGMVSVESVGFFAPLPGVALISASLPLAQTAHTTTTNKQTQTNPKTNRSVRPS